MTALDHTDQSLEIESERDNPNIILRLIWFVLVGWWLGFWAIVAAYLCLVLIIPSPIGIAILNRLPRIFTLRAPARTIIVRDADGTFFVEQGKVDQRSWLIRLPWLLLIGWWAGLFWLSAAYLTTVLTAGFGLPISFWMFGRAAKVITLQRS
jgi:uncharacterized membrane protein YccF (DUF307 family)